MARPRTGWPGYPRSSTNCVVPTPPPNATGCFSTAPSNGCAAPGCSACGFRSATAAPAAVSRDVLTAVIQIARGSSNVAQALRAHFGFSERLLSNRATEAERAAMVPSRRSPDWCSATPSPTPRARRRQVLTPRCSPTPTGVLRLNGYKFYSTGTLFADVIAVSAVDADGRDLQAIVPADRRRRRTLRRLGRLRPATHRQRRDPIHRRRGGPDRGDHRVRRQAPRPLARHSYSCTSQRWRQASHMACTTTRCRTCGRRRARLRIRWPTRRRRIRSSLRP